MESYWFSDARPIKHPKLRENTTTDILIVGGGITGVLTAYILSSLGKTIALVDSDQIGGGETGCTTAHLSWVLDLRYAEIEKLFGGEKSSQIISSHKSAIDLLESIALKERIDCDFKRVDGYLFEGQTEKKQVLENELEALHRLGVLETRLEDKLPLNFWKSGPCLRFPNQAQFHPLKFLTGLTRVLQKKGVRIFENTPIAQVNEGRVETSYGNEIIAHTIIVATHSPIKNILFFLKEAAYRTYAIASKISKNQVPPGLFWDTDEPYHYIRTHPVDDKSDLLIIGGEDHKTGQNDDYEATLQRLEFWARNNFPMFQKMDYVWSGQVIEPMDGLAFIGKSPYHKNIFIATGYSGNGMTYAAIAAMLFSDLLAGRENPSIELYQPTRKNLKTTGNFLKENLNVVKEMIEGHLEGGDIENKSELSNGEGALIQEGLTHVAVYRDEKGKLHESSAICPHLGCVVQWNSAQKTFDCPCHGSRFTGEGHLICGPAIRNLQSHSSEKTLSSKEKI